MSKKRKHAASKPVFYHLGRIASNYSIWWYVLSDDGCCGNNCSFPYFDSF